MNRQERLQKRYAKVRRYVQDMERKHPQWRYSAILQAAEEKFDYSPETIRAIIKGYGKYAY